VKVSHKIEYHAPARPCGKEYTYVSGLLFFSGPTNEEDFLLFKEVIVDCELPYS